MSMIIQRKYEFTYPKGLQGALSLPALEHEADCNGYVAAEDLWPGCAVYEDANGKYAQPIDATTQGQVVGIVMLVGYAIGTPIPNPTGNNNNRIIIPEGSEFTILKAGHIYVEISDTVAKDDMAESSIDGSGTFIKGFPPAKNPMFFDESGVAGDIVSIRVNGLIA